MKDCYWPAVVSAFLTHSLVISAFAFNFPRIGNGQPQILQNHFCVEMVYCDAQPKDHSSTMVPEKLRNLVYSKNSSSRENKIKTQVQERIADNFQKEVFSSQEINEDNPFLKTGAVSTKGFESRSSNTVSFFQPPPTYPREARLRKIQGIVKIQVHLSHEGAVSEARTIPPRVDPILESAALKAVRQWKFTPGVKTLEVPIEFKLEA